MDRSGVAVLGVGCGCWVRWLLERARGVLERVGGVGVGVGCGADSLSCRMPCVRWLLCGGPGSLVANSACGGGVLVLIARALVRL